jgi:hypothetical protein
MHIHKCLLLTLHAYKCVNKHVYNTHQCIYFMMIITLILLIIPDLKGMECIIYTCIHIYIYICIYILQGSVSDFERSSSGSKKGGGPKNGGQNQSINQHPNHNQVSFIFNFHFGFFYFICSFDLPYFSFFPSSHGLLRLHIYIYICIYAHTCVFITIA